MSIFNIIGMAGGLGLFLYGMTILSNGLEKASGGLMEKVLAKMSSNVFSGILFGALVTAAVQSSSATTVIVVGLVNAGLLKLKGAVGIIMGANIGTTMTTQILRLTNLEGETGGPFLLQLCKPSNFSAMLIVIGLIIIMLSKKNKNKNVGEIMMGVGILFTGMILMQEKIAPLAELPQFEEIFATLSNPILGVLVGTVFTAIIQSSAASIGILQALSTSGAITFASAFPIVMGTNIGTCATPLISSVGASKNAKRAAMIHFYFNLIGTIVFLIGVYAIQYTIGLPFWNSNFDTGSIANFHTIFNVTVTILFLPVYTVLEKLAVWTVREKKSAEDDETFTKEDLLDDRFLVTPNVAIAQASEAVVQMGHLAHKNFVSVTTLFDKYDLKVIDKIKEREELIDRLEDRVGQYLIKLNNCGLNEDESRMVTTLFHLISEYERIGDYTVNIYETAEILYEKEMSFSEQASRELKITCDAITEIISLAIAATQSNSMEILLEIEPLEEVVDRIVEELKSVHIDRAKNGLCNIEVGINFLDILTNVERISDHCSNIAIYLIANQKRFTGLKKHEYLDELHKNGPKSYEAKIAEYAEKYSLKRAEEC
ncbi:MAG: Na/Pi cotransporter family protein [Ruminococcus sp.]|nr:Na/Pi cotransporter family protein [Ruminococcus sp.]